MLSGQPFDFEKLLDDKAIAGRGNRDIWIKELSTLTDNLSASGYKPSFVLLFLEASNSIEQLRWVSSFLTMFVDEFDSADQVENYILESVDASDYTLTDWIESALVFHLKTRCKLEATKASRVFAYLACSSEFAKSNPLNLNFTEIVAEMIVEYGFDNRDDI
jgi:hypothetical protein